MAPAELDLLQGTLNVLVLRALSWHPMHGYAVARFIRDGSGEKFRILDGALYTSLHRMEELGWVESSWGQSDKGKRAKYYRLTPRGRKQLASEQSKWQAFARAMGLVLKPADQEAE